MRRLRILLSQKYDLVAAVLVTLLPLLMKAPLLAGILVSDSMSRYAGLAIAQQRGLSGGWTSIDPNIGYTSHALGTYAARELTAGRIPWWNPFEGVGAPLAAGMQSAALFPLTPLLLLPQGQLWFHLTLQIIAGLSCLGLLREMRLGPAAAPCGAVAFQFNGVFAWLANAAVNPVAFLPLLLWGCELLQSRRPRRRAGGFIAIAFGLALSLYAGFPETAYLNGLLVGCWCCARATMLSRDERWRFMASAGIAAVAGLLLAMPIVLPFLDYLPQAALGMHGGDESVYRHLDPHYLLLVVLPYFFGGIFSRPIEYNFWYNVGGYGGTVLPMLAVAALVGRRRDALRWTLAGWIIVTLALSYGAAPVFAVLRFLPGFSEAALYRYLPASWIMAMVVLAAQAVDDMRQDATVRPLLAAVAIIGVGTLITWALGGGTNGLLPRNAIAWVVCAAQGLILLGLVTALLWQGIGPQRRTMLVAGLLSAEVLALFALPVLAHPGSVTVADGGVQFLRQNLGFQRFTTFGPIAPNYGTYFGIAEVNHNDLPAPLTWTRYVRRHLDAKSDPILFTAPSSTAEFLRRRGDYAGVGVRYVVTGTNIELMPLSLVYRDGAVKIYELADSRPYLSAPNCRLRIVTRTELTAHCALASRLTRLELNMPGWRAQNNGSYRPLQTTSEIFQALDLPAGRSVVRFQYAPRHSNIAWLMALLGAISLCAAIKWSVRRFAEKPLPNSTNTGKQA